MCAELDLRTGAACAFLQDVDSIYDIVWARDPETGREVKYGDVRLTDEQQFSVYNFEAADVAIAWNHFELCEAECKKLIDHYAALSKDKSEGDGIAREKSRFPLLGAYDLCLKCSHYFNILDARGAISVTERVGVIARVRALAVGIAKAWMDQQYRPAESKDKMGKGRSHGRRGSYCRRGEATFRAEDAELAQKALLRLLRLIVTCGSHSHCRSSENIDELPDARLSYLKSDAKKFRRG